MIHQNGDRNKKQTAVTHGLFYYRKLLFSGLTKAPVVKFVTDFYMLERRQEMF